MRGQRTWRPAGSLVLLGLLLAALVVAQPAAGAVTPPRSSAPLRVPSPGQPDERASLPAAALDSWTWRNPLPQGNDLLGVAWGGGTGVAVGGKTIVSSVGGADWQARPSGSSYNLFGVGYGNGLFVAVGNASLILTSPDGVHWTQRNEYADTLYGVAYGNGAWVAVGGYGAVFTSPDGEHWVMQDSQVFTALLGVTFGGGLFAATAADGAVLTSTDGAHWTRHATGQTQPLDRIAYGNGRFVATSFNGLVLISPNGADWTPVATGAPDDLFGIAYGGGIFTAVGNGGVLVTSTNGEAWQVQPYRAAAHLMGVAWTGSAFIAVGVDGEMVASPDGVAWRELRTGPVDPFHDVTFGNGQFVAVGVGGMILTSPDGMRWTARATGNPYHFGALTGVAYGGGRFVAVGNGVPADILMSEDGVTWTPQPRESDIDHPIAVTYGGGQFLAVGGGGLVLTSPDGVYWTRQDARLTTQSTRWPTATGFRRGGPFGPADHLVPWPRLVAGAVSERSGRHNAGYRLRRQWLRGGGERRNRVHFVRRRPDLESCPELGRRRHRGGRDRFRGRAIRGGRVDGHDLHLRRRPDLVRAQLDHRGRAQERCLRPRYVRGRWAKGHDCPVGPGRPGGGTSRPRRRPWRSGLSLQACYRRRRRSR